MCLAIGVNIYIPKTYTLIVYGEIFRTFSMNPVNCKRLLFYIYIQTLWKIIYKYQLDFDIYFVVFIITLPSPHPRSVMYGHD